MAEWIPDSRLIRKQWADSLYDDIWENQFFTKFTGSGKGSIIQVNTDLKGKGRGDSVRFGIIYRLEGDMVMDCDILEGKEDSLVEDAMDVTVHLYRKAILLGCQDYMGWLSVLNMRKEAREQLTNFFADYFDREIFRKLATAPTNLRLKDASAGAVTLDLITELKEMAITADPKIRPIMINGKPHYAFVMHNYCARELQMSAEWKQVHMAASVRGWDNPLFTGSLGMWDDVILYSHPSVPLLGDPTATEGAVASNLFLGAQAGVLAQSRDMFWRERDYKDYGMQVGIAAGVVRGFEKVKFQDGKHKDATTPPGPQDYGVITCKNKATRLAVGPDPNPNPGP